jgi:tRNA threonylcarbamoyl adenosine modification protein YeaZ
MRVLAIDTALDACSAAVLDTEAGLLAGETVEMTRGHAEALMPLIAQVMENGRINFDALDRVAVTVGPGSFTGLRVGISAARAIALSISRPAVGLSTLSAYAAPYMSADDSSPVVAVIDARHEQVYLQVFGPGGRTLVGPRITTIREAVRAASTGAVRLVGSAAKLVAAAWTTKENRPALVEARPSPDIEWVARLGAAAVAEQAPARPQYLRAPDAQPQDAASLPRR